MSSNFDLELINRLKCKIDENDWQILQSSLNDEKQLDTLRQQFLEQLEQNQHQMENEWQNINVKEKSKLIANIQNILYDLQLVEHASKKPFLDITKIIFSVNPARCIQRESSPSKSKPPKRRKNELCGLMSSSSEEINTNAAKRLTTTREAKLFGISHQMQQQEEERIELDDSGPSSSNNFGGPLRRGGRTKKKTKGPNSKNSLQQLFSPSPIPNGEKDEEVELEEEEQMNNLMMMISPSPPTVDCPAPMMEFNIGTTSSKFEEHSSSQMAKTTPPQQGHGNGTKTRKRGREIGAADAGIAGGRSPRKRGTERQRNHSESNGQGDGDFEEEKRVANNKNKDEPTYCFCKQVSFGNMVGCDNKNCILEWFHFACVGLNSSPKGKWYCPECRDTNTKDAKK